MDINGLENGLADGRFDNYFVGFANGLVGSEQIISEANTFIFTIRTTSTRTLTLPLVSNGTYSFFVDWGDGKKDYIHLYNQAFRIHTYPTALKNYTVKITGVCRGWSYFGLALEQPKILTIERWGCLELIDDLVNGSQFQNCINLNLLNVKDTLSTKYLTSALFLFNNTNKLNVNLINNWSMSNFTSLNAMFNQATIFNEPLSNWDVSKVTDMSYTFQSATNFNQYISNWDVGNVTTMFQMFTSATNFNQPIGNWNVSGVTNMQSMFNGAINFNQPLSGWNVGNVTTMGNMFSQATNFNQDIGNWNVGEVTNMAQMFLQTTNFNQDIGSWNVSKVTNMNFIFREATNFNQYIGNWNVSGVTNMVQTFQQATNFNQDIGSWNVGNVTNMNAMFSSAIIFNQDIGNWNVGKVTDIGNMFSSATNFNQPIGNWNVSGVTNMNSVFANTTNFNQPLSGWNVGNVTNMNTMFSSAIIFNQDISNWNVGKVTNMGNMFTNATAFNQNIGNWNVSSVNVFTSFMASKTPATFSAANLDAIYNGWSNLQNLVLFNSITFGTAQYNTSISSESKALLSRSPIIYSIVDIVDNGFGLCRVTVTGTHGLNSGNKMIAFVFPVSVTVEANGVWYVNVIDASTIDLIGSSFSNIFSFDEGQSYISVGFGWTIVDGGGI